MLAIRSFSKSYGDELIISVDAMTFAPGIHLIKGDNGSGKTTFFRCVAGIAPSTGEISIDTFSLKKEPIAYRYSVNFAEAEPFYPAFLTPKDLLGFIGRTKNAAPAQVDYYRRNFGIDWFYEKTCDTHSSGMLKKLSLALAFLGDPKLIILDEPLVTLDEVTRGQFYSLMKEKNDTIFLLSSHHEISTGSLDITSTHIIRNKTLVVE